MQSLIVPAGQQFRQTANALHRAGIITDPFKFKVLGRIKGLDKKIKSGEFLLSAAMSPLEILKVLVSGRVRLYKLTVPEGYNQKQIAMLIAEAGFTTAEAFLQACTDRSLLRSKGLAGQDFEGYLFPDTYYFPRPAAAQTIIAAMVHKFWSVFTPAYQAACGRIEPQYPCGCHPGFDYRKRDRRRR